MAMKIVSVNIVQKENGKNCCNCRVCRRWVRKTTTAVNLSTATQAARGKTLLADMDPQEYRNGSGLTENELDKTTYEVITGEEKIQNCIIKDLFDNLSTSSNKLLRTIEFDLPLIRCSSS